MGPALDRLLASPSALRLLRRLVADGAPWPSPPSCLTFSPALACHFRPIVTLSSSPSTSTSRSPSSRPYRRLQQPRAATAPAPAPAPDPAPAPAPARAPAPAPSIDTFHGLRPQLLARILSLYTGAPLFDQIRGKENAYDALLYEADVASDDGLQDRLVDHPDHAHNLDLWLELLRIRKRLHGNPGVVHVWIGMRRRHVDLPVTGPTADAFWPVFLSAGISDASLLDQVYAYAVHLRRSQGLYLPFLYRDLVGACLRITPGYAMHWHNRMADDLMLPQDAARSIFVYALHSRHPEKAFRAFKKIYTRTSPSPLYDTCMPDACDNLDFVSALRWHNFFLKHNDLPSPDVRSRPIINHLLVHSSDHRPRLIGTLSDQYANLQAPPPSDSQLPLFTRANMSTIVGDVHGIKQKKIGDAFCARLFATGAFSMDLVINGLRILGLESLGSLALKEIAARSRSTSEYLASMHSLQDAGISIVESAFSRALHKFATENNTDFFNLIARGDQHPDSYDDPHLQKTLFGSFLASGQLLEAHTTLAILTMTHDHPEQSMWNLLLQAHTSRSDRQQSMQVLHHMWLHKITISQSSLRSMFHRFLAPRQTAKRPYAAKDTPYDLDIVANIFLRTLRSGQYVDPALWKEILRRYGMTDRLVALTRLCLWLANMYSTRVSDTARNALLLNDALRIKHIEAPSTNALPPLAQLFPESFLRALIAWGFKSAAFDHRHERMLRIPPVSSTMLPVTTNLKVQPERWARGIALVRKLLDYGVVVSKRRLRREVELRLWILFGPGRSASRSNRVQRYNNVLPLQHYIEHVEQVWGGGFFNLAPKYSAEVHTNQTNAFIAAFGRRKSVLSKAKRRNIRS